MITFDDTMSVEQLLEACKKLKKQLGTSNKKNEKLEQRFIQKVKDAKQATKLIEENEKSIVGLEQEVTIAKDCLNKVFSDVLSGSIAFTKDGKIKEALFMQLHTELKNIEREKIEQAKQ